MSASLNRNVKNIIMYYGSADIYYISFYRFEDAPPSSIRERLERSRSSDLSSRLRLWREVERLLDLWRLSRSLSRPRSRDRDLDRDRLRSRSRSRSLSRSRSRSLSRSRSRSEETAASAGGKGNGGNPGIIPGIGGGKGAKPRPPGGILYMSYCGLGNPRPRPRPGGP
jgi:hypothetical protein